ncbi:MAG: hypothetical protein RLZZ226_990 [Pseudomonadota bacterium]|jgi:hypothetical protein
MSSFYSPEADPHEVLIQSFSSLAQCYLELLKDADQIEQSREAGKTLRYLARCLYDTPYEFGDLQDMDDDEEV